MGWLADYLDQPKNVGVVMPIERQDHAERGERLNERVKKMAWCADYSLNSLSQNSLITSLRMSLTTVLLKSSSE
jgi:hypothetical protein